MLGRRTVRAMLKRNWSIEDLSHRALALRSALASQRHCPPKCSAAGIGLIFDVDAAVRVRELLNKPEHSVPGRLIAHGRGQMSAHCGMNSGFLVSRICTDATKNVVSKENALQASFEVLKAL